MNVQRLSLTGVHTNSVEMVSTYFYSLNCPITGLVKYIGRTVNLDNRYRNHIYEAKKNNRNKRERWITSLARKNLKPIMKVLWSGLMEREEAIRIEKYLIRRYRKSYDLKNDNDHGLGGSISTTHVYQYSSNGKFVKEFVNANQAYIATGIKDMNITRCCKNPNGYGTKQAGGFFWSYIKYQEYPYQYIDNHRKLYGKLVICMELGKIFHSARQADRELGVNYKHISACCNGKRKSAGGYTWEFV